jgi:hypothetical protein
LIQRRVVYVGCGLAGKSTSLHSLLVRTRQELPDPIWKLSTEENSFRFVRPGAEDLDISFSIANRRGMRSDYDPTSSTCDAVIRREIDRIAAADGLIFVVDSQVGREASNVDHLQKLERDLASRGKDIRQTPIVFQANKRDLAEIVSMDWVRAHFGTPRCAYIESVATSSTGTLEALRAVNELVSSSERPPR